MLFLIILVLLVTMVAIVFIERGRLAIWAAGMEAGLILVILAYAVIWIKTEESAAKSVTFYIFLIV